MTESDDPNSDLRGLAERISPELTATRDLWARLIRAVDRKADALDTLGIELILSVAQLERRIVELEKHSTGDSAS